MALKPFTSRKKQAGVSLLEGMGALILWSVLIAAAGTAIWNYKQFLDNQNMASWLQQWQSAAQQYMTNNQAALLASNGGSVTEAQIVAAGSGYFQPGFPATSPFGQTAFLSVTVSGGNLQGMVCAGGGTTFSNINRIRIGNYVGADGGYVPSTATGTAKGQMWGPVSLSTYGLTAGQCQLVVALFVSNFANVSPYLNRFAVSGQPQVNQMETNIDMNSHALNNVSAANLQAGNSLSFAGASYIYGDASNLALRAASGNVYIQTPAGGAGSIVSVANITGTGTFSANTLIASANVYGSQFVGSSNVFAGVNTSGGPNGNNANVYTGGVGGWENLSYGGGFYMSDTTWIRAYNNKNIYTGGVVYGGGGVWTGSSINFEAATGAAGNGCSAGTLVESTDGTGQELECYNGQLVPLGLHNTVIAASGSLCHHEGGGEVSTQATCPANFHVMGGGYGISSYSPVYGASTAGSAVSNAPDGSLPSGNGWLIELGGANANSCFVAYAVCGQ